MTKNTDEKKWEKYKETLKIAGIPWEGDGLQFSFRSGIQAEREEWGRKAEGSP